jgi:hypothetical protein
MFIGHPLDALAVAARPGTRASRPGCEPARPRAENAPRARGVAAPGGRPGRPEAANADAGAQREAMRALVRDEYGGHDVLKIEEIDKPELVPPVLACPYKKKLHPLGAGCPRSRKATVLDCDSGSRAVPTH